MMTLKRAPRTTKHIRQGHDRRGQGHPAVVAVEVVVARRQPRGGATPMTQEVILNMQI